MSYVNQMDQVRCDAGTAIVVTGTGVVARFINNGLHPVTVNAASYVIQVASTVTPTVIAVKHRPTINSASGETTITTLTVPTSAAIGKVLYKIGLDKIVKPGEEVVFDVTTASTAGSGHFCLRTVPSWDQPGNLSNMILSA